MCLHILTQICTGSATTCALAQLATVLRITAAPLTRPQEKLSNAVCVPHCQEVLTGGQFSRKSAAGVVNDWMALPVACVSEVVSVSQS